MRDIATHIVCVWLAATVAASAAQFCVWTESPSPQSPYDSWPTAAHDIQSAVDFAAAGDTILVTNGDYVATEGRVFEGETHSLVVDRAVRIIGVMGPSDTVIDAQDTRRAVYLSSGASLEGFRVVHGQASTSGGGIYAASSAWVSNCFIVSNAAAEHGGGVYGGTVVVSTISANFAYMGGGCAQSVVVDSVIDHNSAVAVGSGAFGGCLIRCQVLTNGWALQYEGVADGGGLASGVARNCRFVKNYGYRGGGAWRSDLHNCLVMGNGAGLSRGGGGYECRVYSCTVVGNRIAPRGEGNGFAGAGLYGGEAWNTIIWSNLVASDWADVSVMGYCCASPVPPGEGNFDLPPLFKDPTNGDYTLSGLSPCIDMGSNSASMTIERDYAGAPRVRGAFVDLGCFESGVTNVDVDGDGLGVSDERLVYGTSPLMNDTDGDGLSDGSEIGAGTSPISAASVLKLAAMGLSPMGGGIVVAWASVPGRHYDLSRDTSLYTNGAPQPVLQDFVAEAATSVFTDRTTTASGYYRLRVRVP